MTEPSRDADHVEVRIPVVAESAQIAKRVVETERVRVRKTVSEREEAVEALLARRDVSIERVPVNQVVATAPEARVEGDICIVPILEERLVVTKHLVLKEELHIRIERREEPVRENVRLREEHVEIEYLKPVSEQVRSTDEESGTMSGSSSYGSGRTDEMSGHSRLDDGTYDPDRHDNQIVAVFEDRAAANRARDALVQAGVPQSAIQVLDREAVGTTGTGVADGSRDEGLWGAIKSLFAPEDDVRDYHHAIGRGHAMVLVTPSAGVDRQHVIEVLERNDPVDFDSRLAEWRQGGYESSSTGYGSSSTTGSTFGAADTTAGSTTAQPGLGTSGAAGFASGADFGTGSRTEGAVQSAPEETIQVVQERLRVGKREVAGGAVRVRSYVVERPVEEQVNLHEETVSIDRRPVDRPLEAGADAFRERTIEARSTAEEAVIAKEARVVEEIGIHKQAQDRVETVRDTVRETKVEVEEDRNGNLGTGGTTTNPVPRTNR